MLALNLVLIALTLRGAGAGAGGIGHWAPMRVSQQHFAAAFRIPLPTLKNWEQGRRQPEAPAAAYLLAIKRRPKEVMEAVAD